MLNKIKRYISENTGFLIRLDDLAFERIVIHLEEVWVKPR